MLELTDDVLHPSLDASCSLAAYIRRRETMESVDS